MANSGLVTLAVLALSAPGSMLIGGPIGLLGLAPAWALAIWLIATRRVRGPVGIGGEDIAPRPERATARGQQR